MPHKDPEKRKEYWNKRNKTSKRKDYVKKYRQTDKYKTDHWEKYIKKTYSLSKDQVKQMYISQGGICAICGNKFTNRKDMHIDHNHETGQIRQLLCCQCNNGLGNFKENILNLLRAIDYINKWNV